MDHINKTYRSLIIWVLCLIVIGATIGNLTKDGIDSWYIVLNRPPLTPPSYIFGIVWSILYAMIGASGWAIWRSKYPKLGSIKILYASQLLLNWSWTPIFFIYHLTGVALICLLLMTIIVGLIVLKTYQQLNIVAWLLIPYLLWLLFATYLNFYIWQYN